MINWLANIKKILSPDAKSIGFKEYKQDPKLKTLKSNRMLDDDLVQALIKSIEAIGTQISPITVCQYQGHELGQIEEEVEGLKPGDICIIDGQHRYAAVKKINEKRKEKGLPLLTFKVFLNNYVSLDQGIVDHANNVRQSWNISDRVNEFAQTEPGNLHAVRLFEMMKKYSNSIYGKPSNKFNTSALVYLFLDVEKSGTSNPSKAISQKSYRYNDQKGHFLMDLIRAAAGYEGWEKKAFNVTFAKVITNAYVSNQSIWLDEIFFYSLQSLEWDSTEAEFKKNFIRAYNQCAHDRSKPKLNQF